VRARLESLSTRSTVLLIVGVVIVYAAALWLLFVSPKRADLATAREDLVAAELRLAEAQTTARRPSTGGTNVADVLRLAKAMPSTADQSGLVLEVSRLAKQSGVTLRSISPKDPIAGVGSPALIPVTVTLTGSYRQITRFLERTRELVRVRNGKIRATGRLLSVHSVSLIESVGGGFPKLDATLEIDAYVYDGPIVAEETPPPALEEELPATGSDALGRSNS
jgi:Tfp pilus assembly protein PilO